MVYPTNTSAIRATFDKLWAGKAKHLDYRRIDHRTWIFKDGGTYTMRVNRNNVFALYVDGTCSVNVDGAYGPSNNEAVRLRKWCGVILLCNGRNSPLVHRVRIMSGSYPYSTARYMVEGRTVSSRGKAYHPGVKLDSDLKVIDPIPELFYSWDKHKESLRKKLQGRWFKGVAPFLALGMYSEALRNGATYRDICDKIMAEEPFDLEVMLEDMGPYKCKAIYSVFGHRGMASREPTPEVLTKMCAMLRKDVTSELRKRLNSETKVKGELASY